MFGTVVQNVTAATAGAENLLSAALDPDITQQNSQYIFTGPYNLLADSAVGASVIYGRYSAAQWNGWGRPNLLAMNRGLVPPNTSWWALYDSMSLALPQNQQIATYLTNNLGSSTEIESVGWQISTPDWSRNLPPGLYDFIGHATCTVTPAASAWKESQVITFDQLPLGGVYAVIGALCIGGNASYWRLSFPRTRMYLGRRLRPGGMVVSAYGNLPSLAPDLHLSRWGVWGAFHTFELPQFGIFGTAASSTTYDIFMKLRYLGGDVTLLDRFVQSNY